MVHLYEAEQGRFVALTEVEIERLLAHHNALRIGLGSVEHLPR